MTQPAFSRRIKALEEWLGADLFDRYQRCEALLLQSEVQFVLSHAHERNQGLLHGGGYPSVRVGADELLSVSAVTKNGQPMHRLTGASKSTPVQLLGYSAESGLGGILRAAHGLALERLPVRNVFTADLASVLRTMALDGRGIAWLPATLIGEDVSSGRLTVAASDDWRVDLEIRLYRDRTTLGAAAERFWEAVSSDA